MDKNTVIEFFDHCAEHWDDNVEQDDNIISTILTLGGVRQGIDLLDVACGTGVLFPEYIRRGVGSITAIDISSKMVNKATEKFPGINIICDDVETFRFDRQFDVIMIYNAFPHFPDPHGLIKKLAEHTKSGGRLSVAHSLSRSELIMHHNNYAKDVSIELLHEQELANIFSNWFDVDVIISTDRMYQVSGVRRS